MTVRGVYQRNVSYPDLPVSLLRARRAETVRSGLQEMWGDGPPPGPDADLAGIVDGLALDDAAGRRHGLVVQADGLTLTTLRSLLEALPDADRDRLLPALPVDLRQRLLAPVTR